MAAKRKQYTDASYYEEKLARVMERLGVGANYEYNFDRHGAWVQMTYREQLYQFSHSVESAKAAGQKLAYGSDAFAQIVLALEDLARIIERGIYDLQTWVEGLRFLPEPEMLPEAFRILGFTTMPHSPAPIHERYRELSKQYHPDTGGQGDDFQRLRAAYDQALSHFASKNTS